VITVDGGSASEDVLPFSLPLRLYSQNKYVGEFKVSSSLNATIKLTMKTYFGFSISNFKTGFRFQSQFCQISANATVNKYSRPIVWFGSLTRFNAVCAYNVNNGRWVEFHRASSLIKAGHDIWRSFVRLAGALHCIAIIH